jgi:hypothetical protein
MKIICKQCNNEFNIYPARVLKQGKGKYCSKICYTESMKLGSAKKPRREITKDYHNRRRFGGNKYKAFERDGYKCKHCGTDANLEIHHIDGTGYKSVIDYKKSNNNLENLLTLCHKCHLKVTNDTRFNH